MHADRVVNSRIRARNGRPKEINLSRSRHGVEKTKQVEFFLPFNKIKVFFGGRGH